VSAPAPTPAPKKQPGNQAIGRFRAVAPGWPTIAAWVGGRYVDFGRMEKPMRKVVFAQRYEEIRRIHRCKTAALS
jgi:hypothetical protein